MSYVIVIDKLRSFHAEHQDDMPGGAEKLLLGLSKAEVIDSSSSSLHFDKTEVLQLSGGVALSDESKRKRVLQLNGYFEKVDLPFKLGSRKHRYELDFPESMLPTLDNQAFEKHALKIADETDPDDYQQPEGTRTQPDLDPQPVYPMVFVSHSWGSEETVAISRDFIAELERQLEDRHLADGRLELFCDLSDKNNFKPHKGLYEQQDSLCEQSYLCLILWSHGYERSVDCQRELAFFVDEQGQNKANKAAIALLENGRKKDVLGKGSRPITQRILFNYPHGSDHSLIDFWPEANPGEKHKYVASLIDHIEDSFKDKILKKRPDHYRRLAFRHEFDEELQHTDSDFIIKATDKSVDEGLQKDIEGDHGLQDPEGYAESMNSSERICLVPFLANWANSPVSAENPRVTVLLGDFGFGKTVTCRLLAQHLSDQYKEDKSRHPLPVYLDLKALLGNLENNLQQPVQHLLVTMLSRTHQDQQFDGNSIVHYLQTQKCLIIFDGFDEIGHKLNRSQQQALYHKLLDIIPANVFKNDRLSSDHKKWQRELAAFPGKLLISCRTHFFNYIRQETNFFAGNERHQGVSEDNFQRFYMAPFKRETIKRYLIEVLDDEQAGTEAYEMLDKIHDLSGLSQHPIMLKLISRHIPFLQEIRSQNQPVNSALLYLQLFESIGERDTDKHIIKLSIKQKLLAKFALDLWLKGKTELDFSKLEDWFTDFSDTDILLKRQTSGNYKVFDLMLGDLCNATLLVRDGDDKYRFAHTSYLEFFRGLGIFEFIRSGEVNTPSGKTQQSLSQHSELPELNNETLQFIINWWQVSDEEDRIEFKSQFIRLLEKPLNQNNKWLGFILWRFALKSLGHPLESQFPHTNAPDWSEMEFGNEMEERFISPKTIKSLTDTSVEKMPKLDLSHADFTGSYFLGQQFLAMDLSYARFEQAHINQCDFAESSASKSSFNEGILRHSLPPAPLTRPLNAFASALHPNKTDNDNQWSGKNLPEILAEKCHRGSVGCVAFTSDGRFLASAGSDSVIRIWDTHRLYEQPEDTLYSKPRCILELHGHQGYINTLHFSHDARFLASAGVDCTIIIWDTHRLYEQPEDTLYAKPQCILELHGHQGYINTLHFSHDARLLASAGDDSIIRIWAPHRLYEQPEDMLNAKPRYIFELHGYQDYIQTLHFSHDARFLASAGDDGTIRIWDTHRLYEQPEDMLNAKPRYIFDLHGHQDFIRTLHFSHDAKFLASAGDDRTIRIWDTHRLYEQPEDSLNAKPRCIFELHGHQGFIRTLHFSHDARFLSSAGDDRTIRIWDTHRLYEQPEDSLNAKPRCIFELHGHQGYINTLHFSHDARLLASSGDDSTIRIWDTHRLYEQPEDTLNAKPRCIFELHGHQHSIYTLHFSHDARFLASAGHDRTIRIWDTHRLYEQPEDTLNAKTRCILELHGHQDFILTLHFSHDARFLASAGGDRTIRIWDTHRLYEQPEDTRNAKHRCILELHGHQDPILTLQFSHDARFLASAGGDRTIRIWDTHRLYEQPEDALNAKPRCILKLRGHEGFIYTLHFSHDARFLASAGDDSTIRIWDTHRLYEQPEDALNVKPRYILKLHGYKDFIYTLHFSHDARFLASAGNDSTIRIWDTHRLYEQPEDTLNAKPHCIFELDGHQHSINSLHFSHDARFLASAGNDRTIRIWDFRALYEKTVDNKAITKDKLNDNTPPCILELKGHKHAITALQFSDNSQYLWASAGDSIYVWNLNTQQCEQILTERPNGYYVFATECQNGEIVNKKLISAGGDAWKYLYTRDDKGGVFPAACYEDWEGVYTP